MNDVALLCIGTELLDGSTRDLNLKFLGQFLDHLNIKLKKAIFCSDSPEEISKHLGHRGLLIISGGLGPTLDDVTKSTLASYFQEPQAESSQAVEICMMQFGEKEKNYDLQQYNYHHIPKNFDALYNKIGYAPGLYSQKHKVLALPGVPREFQEMIKKHLPNYIKKEKLSKKLTFKTRGIIEINIFKSLDKNLWETLSQYGEVSSLPKDDGVDIGVRISARYEEKLDSLEYMVRNTFKNSKISEYIWSHGEEVEVLVHQYLQKLGKTISIAESCTGGLISSLLTSQAGSSQYFIGSLVAYQNKIKISELGIEPKLIEKFGVVSKETSQEMALKVRQKFKTDYSIATTGHLEYTDQLAPHIWISIASKDGVLTKPFQYYKDRETVKKLFAKASLHLLRIVLLKEEGNKIGNAN